MLTTTAEHVETTCHKLEPQAKLPGPSVLRGLTLDDERALKRLLVERVEYIANRDFDAPDAAERYLVPRWSEALAADDDAGAQIYATAVAGMTKDERERFLFMRLNFCRRQVFQILADHRNTRLNSSDVQELLHWEREARRTEDDIVRDNVPLVLAMAKRTRIIGVDLTDLISDGNLALLRSVTKFDCARGYKFSTYACRAILKSFSRIASRTTRRRGFIPTEFDPEMQKGDSQGDERQRVEEDCIDELRAMLDGQRRSALTDVERRVIQARFALEEPQGHDATLRAKTLEQVGEMIGVTKERVRQIQNKALQKLRHALEVGILAP